MDDVVDCLQVLHPEFDIVFLFDHSQGHARKRSGAATKCTPHWANLWRITNSHERYDNFESGRLPWSLLTHLSWTSGILNHSISRQMLTVGHGIWRPISEKRQGNWWRNGMSDDHCDECRGGTLSSEKIFQILLWEIMDKVKLYMDVHWDGTKRNLLYQCMTHAIFVHKNSWKKTSIEPAITPTEE